MEKKKVILAVFLVVAAVVAVGMSVAMLINKGNNVMAVDPSDPNAAVTNGENPTPTPSSTWIQAVLDSPSPTEVPSVQASHAPSDAPTTSPSTMTEEPSHRPSDRPTQRPAVVKSVSPTSQPSLIPSKVSSNTPSVSPSVANSQRPDGCRRNQELGNAVCRITVFYAIADVPYTNAEVLALPQQIMSLPDNAEFLIHLGDIRSAANGKECLVSEYKDIADTLKLSRVPVFIVPGDNEWNDCSNINDGWRFWEQELSNFEDHWDHSFQVTRPVDRPENFAFIHKKTLFVGLNIVAGRVNHQLEWYTRLTEQAIWTTGLMRAHTGGNLSVEQVRSIVIFGHANPTILHDSFFLPLKFFIRDELAGDIPVLYLNGDAHAWSYETEYLALDQLLRIQLTGGTSEPPLQVVVAPTDDIVESNAENVFLYDRRL